MKIYNIKDKIEYLDEVARLEYNEWADKMSALTEVSHMNTFMKDGWYKMVVLYK
jgi:hypothetical protein